MTTDATSVKFTVIRKGYFDAPGSTITFSTWADKEGNVHFTQTAAGNGTDLASILGIFAARKAHDTWEDQKDLLVKKLSTLGKR